MAGPREAAVIAMLPAGESDTWRPQRKNENGQSYALLVSLWAEIAAARSRNE